MRILVVDDSGYMRAFLRMILTNAGHEALEALPTSLFEVLATVKGVHPDVLVTDLEMPGCHGEDLIRAIREDPQLRPLPIVVVSSHGEAELVGRLGRWGLWAYLLKPVTPEALLGALERGPDAGSPAGADHA